MRSPTAWVVTLSLGLIALAGCDSVGLRSMKRDISLGLWGNALKNGKSAVAENPKDAEAWAKLAVVAAKVDSVDLMIKAVDNASTLSDAFDEEVRITKHNKYNELYNKSVTQFNAGDYVNTVNTLNTAVRVDSTRPLAHRLLGTVYQRNNDTDGAIDAYRKAYKADETHTSTAKRYANMLILKGEKTEALEVFAKLYKAQPENLTVINGYVYMLKGAEKWDKALEIGKEGLTKHPTDPLLNMTMGEICVAKASGVDSAQESATLENSIPYFQAAMDSGRTNAAFNMAVVFKRLGQLDKAIVPMQVVLAKRPDDHQARLKLAEFYISLDKPDEADTELQKIIAGIGDPTDAKSRMTLSRGYLYLSTIYTYRGQKIDADAQAIVDKAKKIRRRSTRRAEMKKADALKAKAKDWTIKGTAAFKLFNEYK
jgi:tetratricopeptide (TPR) repeat protein